MTDKNRYFEEAIELFKVIDTCLSCYYDAKTHMYRPLSAQLRILLCDINSGKNKALLLKLFSKITLTPLKKTEYREQNSFDTFHEWANKIKAQSIIEGGHPKIALMPFEITVFKNGLEVCDILLDENGEKISLQKWLNQLITIHPSRITIIELIRSVADRGGGAHIHHKADDLLNSLQKFSPCKTGIDALLTIAFGRFVQQIGWMVIQFYEKLGVKGKIDDLIKIFDSQHSAIMSAAKIPEELFKQESTKFNLTSVTLV